MTPDEMSEKIVRYEWQSVAELASLLSTWRMQVAREAREERSMVMRHGALMDADEWMRLPEVREASVREALEWARKPPRYDCKRYPRSLEMRLAILGTALIDARKECADRALAWVAADAVDHRGLRGTAGVELRAAIMGEEA